MDAIEELLGAPFAAEGSPFPGRRDRVRGMLYGVALGDALGAPHSFPRGNAFHNQVPLARYSGALERCGSPGGSRAAN